MESNFTPLNVGPFATNVLDLVNKPGLRTRQGARVEIARIGMDAQFRIRIYWEGNIMEYTTPDNLQASYFLNSHEVGL